MANTTISQLTTQLNDPADSALFAAEQGSTQKTTKEAITKKIKTDVVLQKSASVPVSANSITLDVEKNSIFHVLVDSPVNTINVSNLSSTHDTNIEINFQQNSTGGYAINFNGITIIWQQAPTGLNTQADMLSTVRLKHRAGTAFWVGVFDGSVALNGQTGGNNGGVNNPPVVSNYIPNGTATEQQPYTYTIPANTFTDPDGDTLTYSASYSSWLSFDPVTRILTGTPTVAGTQSVTITATDTSGASASDSFNIVIDSASGANSAPQVLNPIPDSSVTEGTGFVYTFDTNVFYDPDGDALTYASNATGWLTFNAGTRTFSGTPGAGDVGTTIVTVTATDPSFASATDQFSINVTAAQASNNAPVVANPLGNTTATEGIAFNYTVPSNAFSDPDGDTLTYTSNATGWLSFNAVSRVFSGTPASGDVGIHNITVTATDPSLDSANDTFQITVQAAQPSNNAPTIVNPIVNQGATEGEAFTFTFSVNTFDDPDGDTLTYTSNASGWLSFNGTTRTFSGTPTAGLGGSNLLVTVIATDPGGLTVQDSFTLTIANPPAPIIGTVKGMNSNWVSGYDTPSYFSNIARYLDKWENTITGKISTNQYKGQITTANATDHYRAIVTHPTYQRPVGNYTIRWAGTGELALGGFGAPEAMQTWTTNKNFTLAMDFDDLYVWFRNGSLTSLEIIQPGELAAYDSGNEWSAEYLNFYATLNSSIFRFMNICNTSHSTVTDFSDVATTSDISYMESVPVSVMCDFATRTGSDIWYDAPPRGTDACFTSLAQQFAAHKSASTVLFIKVGNEIWNIGAPWASNTRWIDTLGVTRHPVTTSHVTNYVTWTNHGLVTGDRIRAWITKDYGWRADESPLPWQFNTGDDLEVVVINANEFQCKDKWSGAIITMDERYPNWLMARNSEVTTNLNDNIVARTDRMWDIFKLHVPAAELEFALGSWANNPWYTEQRVLALPDLNTVSRVALAPYYTAAFWSMQVVISGTTATPMRYCSEANQDGVQLTITAAIYPNSSTPSQQDIENGTGAISHETVDSTGGSSTYTAMTAVTGLTTGASYKMHCLMTDKFNITNVIVIPFTQTDQTITQHNANADMARREIAEMSLKITTKTAEHVAVAQGIPLSCYEGGPHYHHTMPPEVYTWLATDYWTSLEAENTYSQYLSIISALGYKELCIYKDMSESRFGIAFNYAGVATDSRAKGYKNFGAQIPEVEMPSLTTSMITLGSAPTTGNLIVDYAPNTTSSLAVTYAKSLGDEDGLFTLTTDGKLNAGDVSKYNWATASTRKLLIEVDNGTYPVVFVQDFTLGGGGSQSAPLDLVNPPASSNYGISPIALVSGDYIFVQDGSNDSGAITVTNWLPAVANNATISVTLTVDVTVGSDVYAAFDGVTGGEQVTTSLASPVVAATMSYTNTTGATVTPNFRISTYNIARDTSAKIRDITYTT